MSKSKPAPAPTPVQVEVISLSVRSLLEEAAQQLVEDGEYLFASQLLELMTDNLDPPSGDYCDCWSEDDT